MDKLPKTIYSRLDIDANDPENSYLETSEDIDSFDDGTEIGVYELKSIKTITVKRTLK